MITSLSSLSLPRLPGNMLRFLGAEMDWYRWSSIITFVGYTLGMAIILFLHDYDALPTHTCFGESSIIPHGVYQFIIFVIALGLIKLIILECYLKWGYHLLFDHIKSPFSGQKDQSTESLK